MTVKAFLSKNLPDPTPMEERLDHLSRLLSKGQADRLKGCSLQDMLRFCDAHYKWWSEVPKSLQKAIHEKIDYYQIAKLVFDWEKQKTTELRFLYTVDTEEQAEAISREIPNRSYIKWDTQYLSNGNIHWSSTIKVKDGSDADIDLRMQPIIRWLESFPSVYTGACCEGSDFPPSSSYITYTGDSDDLREIGDAVSAFLRKFKVPRWDKKYGHNQSGVTDLGPRQPGVWQGIYFPCRCSMMEFLKFVHTKWRK